MSSLQKKIMEFIRDPATRFRVFSSRGFYNSMPDEKYLSAMFRFRMGRELDLTNPKSFNEKLQWLKIYDRRPEYSVMVDKYEAKKYVADILGPEYTIPSFGVWDSFDQIDFKGLPQQFVLKCTHDSGGLVLCREKETLDIPAAKAKIQRSLKRNYYYHAREWPYKDVKPRILAEEYMSDPNDQGKGLTDYKFFCFNGKPMLLYISRGLEHHPTAEISFYDLDGNEMPYHRSDYKPYHNAVLPEAFQEMTGIAERLAAEIRCPFVRIDLYWINRRIYFSEITFSPCGGFVPFEPATADDDLGKLIHLPIASG